MDLLGLSRLVLPRGTPARVMEDTAKRPGHLCRRPSCQSGISFRETEWMVGPNGVQFVDSLILMRTIRLEAHRRIAFLIAEKSMHVRGIGFMARLAGAIPVSRAMDLLKPGQGRIYLPDPENDPLLVRGIGTKFDTEVQAGGSLALPSVNGSSANAEVFEINGPEELRLKKGFKGRVAMKQLTGREDVDEEGRFVNGISEKHEDVRSDFRGSSYKTAPKVDQTKVYNAVFQRLNQGGCVGIFPEGGSHDRTELLPLKRKSVTRDSRSRLT